jgi:putative heme transporter
VRLPRHHKAPVAAVPDGDGVTHVELDAGQVRELSSTFAPPRWLRDLGRTAWNIVGAFALIVGLVFLLGATATITGPVVVAAIVATVAMPVVARLTRHMPRAAAAALVLLALVAMAVGILLLVIGGISGQRGALGTHASAAADKAQGWLEDVGVSQSSAAGTKASVEGQVPRVLGTLVSGVLDGIRAVTSLVFALSLGALSLFFLLKDGPVMRGWVDSHLGVPQKVAQTITSGVIRSLRGYFRGVTIVAAFNGVLVGAGALLLGVPLAGTIGLVTFVTAYIPFIGAFIAGALAVIVLLANGLLQNLVQPFAMGAALDLNPLVVLVATIGAGCLFGTIGLILAAPLLSAAVHISRDLAYARASAGAAAAGPPAPG